MNKQTDKELISEARGLHDSIYVIECYGINDMRRYDAVCEELVIRGYEITVTERLNITKD